MCENRIHASHSGCICIISLTSCYTDLTSLLTLSNTDIQIIKFIFDCALFY